MLLESLEFLFYDQLLMFLDVSQIIRYIIKLQKHHQTMPNQLSNDSSISKSSVKMQIQKLTNQINKQINYQKITNSQLIVDNQKVLEILRTIQAKIDRELQNHKKNMLLTNPHHKTAFNPDQSKILQDQQLNNQKILNVLQKNYQHAINRKKLLESGQQIKTIQKKHQLQKMVRDMRVEIKQLKSNQKGKDKQLQQFSNFSQSDYMKEFTRMEEQLRIYSIKYMKILAQYNKVTQQLALATTSDDIPFQIPQEIYNSQLQQKQQAQYKQYQSIVKLCKILSKRNDSENNKAHRIYTQKLKDLQKVISRLTEVQKGISTRQNQIIQGKKNIQIIKIKMTNNQKIQKQLFRISLVQTGDQKLRQKSYSTAKLGYGQKDSQNQLRNRGYSFAKLPLTLKRS